MITRTRLTTHNPLIRRLRQHGALATLFRAYAPENQPGVGQAGRFVVGDIAATSSPITLPETGIAPTDDQAIPTPSSEVVDTQRVTPSSGTPLLQRTATATVAASRPAQVALQTAAALPPAQAVGSTATSTLAPAQTQGTQAVNTPAPARPTPAAVSAEDQSWAQLQAIMRGHAERQRDASGGDESSPVSTPSEVPPADQASAPLSTTTHPLRPAEAAVAATQSSQSQPLETIMSARRPLQRSPNRATASQNTPVQQASAAPALAQQPMQASAIVASSSGGQIVLPEQSVATTASALASQPTVTARQPTVQTARVAVPPTWGEPTPAVPAAVTHSRAARVESDEGTVDDDTADHDDETDDLGEMTSASTATPRQSLPLEAAWPVQRAGAHFPSNAPDEALSASTTHALTTPNALSIAPEIADNVRQRLQTIATEQPTAALVDVIAPRRPPPVRQPRPVVSAEGNHAAPLPVQRAGQDEQNASAPGAAEPALVDTAIGPLPVDLWQLLGETPPIATQQPVVATGMGAMSAPDTRFDQAAQTTPGDPLTPDSFAHQPSVTSGPATPIQRAGGASTAEPAPASSGLFPSPGPGDAISATSRSQTPILPARVAGSTSRLTTQVQQAIWPAPTTRQQQFTESSSAAQPGVASGENAKAPPENEPARPESAASRVQRTPLLTSDASFLLGTEAPQTGWSAPTANQRQSGENLSTVESTTAHEGGNIAVIENKPEQPAATANSIQPGSALQRALASQPNLEPETPENHAPVESAPQTADSSLVPAGQAAKPGRKKSNQRDGQGDQTTAAPTARENRAGASLPTVQRQPVETAVVKENAPGPSPASEQVAGPAAAEQKIDTDELARQVYTQVKRKLAVERERLRR